MSHTQLDFKRVNRYLPFILLAGVGIGTTNYLIHSEFNWLQWIILSSSTSFIIGYTLLWIASNKSLVRRYLKKRWVLYLVLLIIFAVIGVIATEIEVLIKTTLFLEDSYVPLSSSSLFIPNSVISVFLGFTFFLNHQIFPTAFDGTAREQDLSKRQEQSPETKLISKIPIKRGDKIQLIQVGDVVYFEAYDNYSHLYDTKGQKMLCDYSLIFLESRLDKDFLRIHRKYIVNTAHIQQITPHLNGRFLIRFKQPGLDTITSSKGYLPAIRKLVKIE